MVSLSEVGAGNWRDCAALEVTEDQRAFVAPVTRYLAMCAYGDTPWRPLAVEADGRVVGFAIWAVDPDDQSYWIGGLVVDAAEQRKGYGRAVVQALLDRARAGRPPVRRAQLPAGQHGGRGAVREPRVRRDGGDRRRRGGGAPARWTRVPRARCPRWESNPHR